MADSSGMSVLFLLTAAPILACILLIIMSMCCILGSGPPVETQDKTQPPQEEKQDLGGNKDEDVNGLAKDLEKSAQVCWVGLMPIMAACIMH
eukprot:1083904-Pelagomonas_calceolata.AAC.1